MAAYPDMLICVLEAFVDQHSFNFQSVLNCGSDKSFGIERQEAEIKWFFCVQNRKISIIANGVIL